MQSELQLVVTIWIAIAGTLGAFLALKSYFDRKKGVQPSLLSQPIVITPVTLITANAVAQSVKKRSEM